MAGYKICPACATNAQLHTSHCHGCGHIYRTQFVGANQTVAIGAVGSVSVPSVERNQLAAALLAFFLGYLGAHWFYLGDRKMGFQYMASFFVGWATLFFVVGGLFWAVLGICCLYDFVTHLSMSPQEFNLRYNA